MSDSQLLVVLDGVSKGYGHRETRVEVLQNVALQVPVGELLAVVGPSGVGKSTLLHLIGLLDRPDQGSLVLDQTPVEGLDKEERARYRNRFIGFVFQHHYLLDELDARDNVALPLRIAGSTATRARERADALLEVVGLSQRSHHFPDELSGGEQQRVAVARALAMKPRLLLADEPTGNLDSANADQIFELVQRLHAQEGLTSIVVTHNQEMAHRCDRVFHLAPFGEASGYV